MENIEVNRLKPGMIFSESVYIDETNLFILAGVPIQQKDLDKLKDWRVETVQTDGAAYSDKEEYTQAATQKITSAVSLVEVEENKNAYHSYTSFIEQMNMIFLKISARDNESINESIKVITTQLLQVLKDQKEQFVGFILGGEIKSSEMAKSSVNTAIISVLIAQELKLPHYKIFNITIGALLHDVGMYRLPKSIIEKQGKLSEEERHRIQNHTLYSHMILTKELSYADEVGDIVLQHHEHWDGSGYPEQRSGNNINIGARIVSIADAYEAMISRKPYRNSMVGYEAMKNLLTDRAHCFDPNIVKAFILIMGIYPIGSIVGLNNGIVARVVEVRADAPLRPRIQIVIDQSKKMFKNGEGPFIDLLQEYNLYVTQAMDAKELSAQYA